MPVLTYLSAGILLVWAISDRAEAWRSGQDPDARWHLLALACGMGLALLLR